VGVVEHGSGFAARIDGFKNRIAGKTGTASIPENGKYLPDQTIGSFVGFLPADHPQFIMLVITRKPQVLFEGAYVAAPIWQTAAAGRKRCRRHPGRRHAPGATRPDRRAASPPAPSHRGSDGERRKDHDEGTDRASSGTPSAGAQE